MYFKIQIQIFRSTKIQHTLFQSKIYIYSKKHDNILIIFGYLKNSINISQILKNNFYRKL